MKAKTSKNEKKQENTEINANLEQFQNSHPKERKTRFFSLMTYADDKQILKVCTAHASSIRAMCYIYHDKDDAIPHRHILLRTYSVWTPRQIAKWFDGLTDKKREKINTFCESANSIESLEEYLFHEDEKSRAEGKHVYDRSELHDYGYSDLHDPKNSHDESYEIINRIIAGANPRDLVRLYGRDFVYHVSAYYECADRIEAFEGYKESRIRSRLEAPKQNKLPKIDPEQMTIVHSIEEVLTDE